MVKINKIVMQGFKSFQRKTAIPLFEGFNAVIGPNGSGKTAILDALCFVLGRSSRTLRGDRMDHIIFNGGYGKKPATHAMVSLHLNNKNNIIPNVGEEVIVSRRVNRRGTSTYRLNEKVVNRSRILEVLRYGRIDPYGHNIIQQGEITNIIEMKPKQRREIIDEVAGIREYNEKKDRALKELDKAQIKLNESSVIMEEKRQQLEKLKRERDQALKYNNLEKELEKSKATLAFSRVKVVKGEMENITRNLEIKENELKNLEKKVDEFDDSLPEAEKRVREIEKEIMRKSVNKELRKEIEEINNDVLIKDGKVNSNRREIERIDDMIHRLTQLSKREIKNEAVKALLNKEGVFGTISTLSEIDNKYRIAIEIAVGPHLNDIVVDSENNAISYVDYLKSNNLGRVRFLPLNRLTEFKHSGKAEIASNMKGIMGFAVNLIKYDRKYDIAFKQVFRDTLIAENVEAARRIKGIRVVTLDGELFEAGGAIVGGSLRKRKFIDTKELEGLENEKEELNKEISKLKVEIGELNKKLDDKRKLESKEGSSVIKLDNEKRKLEEEIENKKSKRKSLDENGTSLETEVNELKIRRSRLEGEYDNLMIDYEPYKDRDDLVKEDPTKLQREIRKIGIQLKNIGIVNLKSIEEFDGFNKEYGEFIKKVEKLGEERKSIIKMIENIEEKRRKMFMETLGGILKEFSVVYSDMTNGIGELELEETKDIDSGLIIRAQPENKKLLSIDALSGGEKVIAALAFLFAIQRYRPAPFYMLDEIDAALDKENSEKIGKLIEKYSKYAQFLMISHNDTTVKNAERIYGVSMQKGVSQILGVELKNN